MQVACSAPKLSNLPDLQKSSDARKHHRFLRLGTTGSCGHAMAGAPLRPDAWGSKGSTYADTKTGHAQGQDRRRAGAWHSASSLHAPLRHDMGSITREGCTVLGLRRRWLRFEPPSVAAPWGPCTKVWPPCSFSNKEPSKTTVWLPCSGHVQEQKRLPPRIPDESTRRLQGADKQR